MNPGSILVSVATIILLACAGCSGGNDDRDVTQDVTVADVVEDTREDAGWPLHSVTSATPLVESAILTDSHHGWKWANCSKCHVPDHGGTSPQECAVCHGSNGAMNQPIGHATGNCAACHGSVHAEVKPAFVGPGDCAACHRFQDAGVCPLGV